MSTNLKKTHMKFKKAMYQTQPSVNKKTEQY